MKKPEVSEGLWIDTEIELPEKDGYYYVTNHPNDPFDFGCCFYDGYGFILERIYRNVNFWAYQKNNEKRYGKIKKECDH